MSQLKYDSVDTHSQKLTINGIDFFRMKASVMISSINLVQYYIATIKNGFAIALVVSFTNEEQENEIMKSVNSISFKR